MTGSSPLTRGKRACRASAAGRARLIPAHAGKARLVLSESDAPLGSSPLTRGKRVRSGTPQPRTGLIPAHAGKTLVSVQRLDTSRAHPRSRGENSEVCCPRATTRGSSPLTRGKLMGKLINGVTHRAHPRSRGENSTASCTRRRRGGSSPLTRGKRDAFAPGVGDPGLIPAHAGKTGAGRRVIGPLRAHPRSRGENVIGNLLGAVGEGSSPLTRGKRDAARCGVGCDGLIPAHAGKTEP